MSDRTLTRLCRAELGMSFPQWRTQLRLHHALRLLAEGTPVTAVAHQCGWASSSAFIDVFRRAFGHTPGTHRALSPTAAAPRRALRETLDRTSGSPGPGSRRTSI
ncbi:helix-turn-helix domain-containing protein [Streptosporangium canum]|uniref:helix-turn-helix domain-containing protein n=1 Tax=Streptosporangium canum TaxID=324952 RepID=UPI0033B80B94